MKNLLPQYPYLYETHLHTSQGSRCAKNTGAEMAEACKAAGYTGIIVTDHHWGGNCAVDFTLPWEQWVQSYCTGYRDAKQTGDRIGLDVFFGWEAGFMGTEFLVYGPSPEWMLQHPEIRTESFFVKNPDYRPMTVEDQFRIIGDAGGMVVHAHPFREEWYIKEVRLYPEYVHGVEIFNATHPFAGPGGRNNPAFDTRAAAYAAEHALTAVTAGSDIHSVDLFGGGMAFKRKLASVEDFCKAVRSGEDYVLSDGFHWYDKTGCLIDGVICKARKGRHL